MARRKLSDKGSLEAYSAKRAFDVTPEPAPSPPKRRSGPLLFVIQQHSARRLHYDFRLECEGVLKSWAVPKGPSLDPAEKRLAVQTEDHPFDYASFEGVIPPGQYGAGEVIVWDCGVYSPDEEAPWVEDREAAERQVMEGLRRGKLSVFLRGTRVKGSFALLRTADARNWLLIKHKDRFTGEADMTGRDRSVLSGVSVEEMKAAPAHRISAEILAPAGRTVAMPRELAPMLAESREAPFNHADWMWEPKLDGYRVLAFIRDGQVSLRSRRGLELGGDYPALARGLASQGASMILDGEIVGFDATGRASFNAVQNRSGTTVLYCFDLLYFAGVDLRGFSYADRRRYLEQCLLPSPLVRLVHATDDGVGLYAASLANGLEGVIGKRKASKYEAGRRSASWVKVKSMQSAEFVIGGFTRGKGSREPLGAVLVGVPAEKGLRYAGHVGSGFNEEGVVSLHARLLALKTSTCPFTEKPPLQRPTTWVKPELVAEVRFQEWTPDGYLRAPVYLRLRDDLEARAAGSEVDEVLQQLDGVRKASFTLSVGTEKIRLSHLDRVYWPADPRFKQPALTKRDLLRYLARVSSAMLPHLADRPLTMIRMPDGIDGQRFHQKHWAQEKPPFVATLTVFSQHKDESHEVLVCNNLPTLLWLAQSGTLEFHVWHSRARPGPDTTVESTDFASSAEALEDSILNYPDFVVFDIDPYIYSGKEAPGQEPELNTVAFEKAKEVAFRLRELLNTMSLEPVVKTSGKTGLHVFVPIRRTVDFDAVREVSELVGRHLMRLHPKDITLEWSVPKRTGKIFMDYNMNVRGKTLNVAYSPRGVAGAPASMPLTWEELANAHPLDFRLTNIAERVAQTGDVWRDVLQRKQDLGETLKRGGR